MKRFLVAGATIFIASGVPALAADIPTKATPALIWNWTGFYAGVHAGYSSGHINSVLVDDNAPAEALGTSNWRGSVVGAQVGYNYQIDKIVVGLEGDWSWTEGNRTISNTEPDTANARLSELASIRGRLGFLLNPNSLLYATGGWGRLQANYSITDLDVGSSAFRVSDGGAVYGAGIEYMFDPKWTVRVEYLHYIANKLRADTTSIPGATVNSTLHDVDVVRAGLSYKFDWGKGPVSAKY